MIEALPPLPGTAPLKPGYVRLYHQTGEKELQSIETTGLTLNHARGIEGPKAIWADEKGFYGDPAKKPTLEFQVPKDKWIAPFVMQDVMPEDFLAVHYPWHYRAHYILEHPQCIEQCLAGKYDALTGSDAKAVQYVKGYLKAQGRTASAPLRLLDIYDQDEIDNPLEAMHSFITPDLMDKSFEVQEMGPSQLKRLQSWKDSTTIVEMYREASREQKELVLAKMKRFDATRVVVTAGATLLDGYHHVMAAIKLKRPVRYINIYS